MRDSLSYYQASGLETVTDISEPIKPACNCVKILSGVFGENSPFKMVAVC